MSDITGLVLVILGAACLFLRISMYKSGNPFRIDESDVARLPQMILLLLLSETFMMFGIYYVGYPFPTTSTVTITSISSNAVTQTTAALSSTTSPIPSSYQIINIWIVALIYSFIMAFLLFADALALLNEGAQNGL